MRLRAVCLSVFLFFLTAAGALAQPQQRFVWPRAGVTEVDIDASVPERLDRELKEKLPRVISLGIVRRGKLVYEYYKEGTSAETPVNVASVTKSVLGFLVAIAFDKGIFRSADQKIVEFFPELAREGLDPRVKSVTLGHMLSMMSGWESKDTDLPPFLALDALYRPFAYQPGEKFQYDNATSHLLSIALGRASGLPVETFAERHLFGPMDIANYTWGRDSEGRVNGWHMLSVTLHDMLKIGQLVVNNGVWQGHRVVSEAAMAEMLQRRNDGGPPGNIPYAFQWYVLKTPDGRHPVFAASGYGGQLLYVVPALELVIAKTQTRDQRFGDVAFLREIVMKSLR